MSEQSRACLVTHEQHSSGRHTFLVMVDKSHYFVLHSTRRVKRVTCDKAVYVVRLNGAVPELCDRRMISYPVPDTDPVMARGLAEARQAALDLIPRIAHLVDGSMG